MVRIKAATALLAAACALCASVFPLPAASAEAEINLEGACCALLIDAATGAAVIEKAADEQTEFAGLVRLPALLYICRAFDAGEIFDNTVVTVSPEASRVKGATAFLAAGERIRADYLLQAAVMLNAGDAVCALLEALCPGGAAGAEAVSALLGDIGVERKLSSPMGTGERFSANELASVCRELAKSPSFLKYSSVYTDTLRHENAADTALVNPNRLVRHYSGCCGLATGSVGGSAYCGAFMARRGGTAFIAIIAGCASSDTRFTLARELLDYGFAAYRTVELMAEGEAVAVLPVKGGILSEVSVITGGAARALTPVNDTGVTSKVSLPEAVEAPIDEGGVLGELLILNSGGSVICSVPLVAAHAVSRAGYGERFMQVLLDWLGIDINLANNG